MERRFAQVDVFTTEPYRGNPLAVVLDAEGLDTTTMQRFTNWTDLSETAFLVPPRDAGADYRVRIFTPVSELPFAGHPTLGSCHAWLAAGGVPTAHDQVIQECGAGLVPIRRADGRLAFAAPPLIRSGPVEEATMAVLAGALGIRRDAIVDAAWVDNGPGWVAVLLEDADQVLAIRPRPVDLDIGIVGPLPSGSAESFEVRALFPKDGALVEDPVTGSLHASLAQWLISSGRATPPYVARQGTVLGRAGRAHVNMDPDGTIWVGGGTVTCVIGTVDL